ncbi:6-bladed beta-propeller [Gemmatimonadota bacterium]
MNISMWFSIAALFISVFSLPAHSHAQHNVILSEIDGVPLVRTEGGPKYPGQLFEVEEELVLGIDEGEPEWQLFYGSPTILVAPDGKMVLTDIRKCAVYILTRDGELIAQVGGSGSGPGEFRQPYATMWAVNGESFLVNDYALNRATGFSMTGDLLDTENYGQAMGGRIMRFVSLGDNRYLGRRIDVQGRIVAGQKIDKIKQYWFLNSKLEPAGAPVELNIQNSFAITTGLLSTIPYTREPECIPYTDGRILLAEPDEGRLTVLSSAGEPLKYIERDWARPRLSAEDKKEGRRRFVESDQAEMRRAAGQIRFPSRRTAFARVMADDRGRIWVEYENGLAPASALTDYYRCDVFGPDGVWLGIQEFDFYPALISGDHVYRRGSIEGEGPRLRRYSLNPTVPEATGKTRK